MKIICTKEEQEKLVEILSNTQETLTLSIIEWEIINKLIDNASTVHHPNCDNCEDKAKQYSLGFQDGYMIGKERLQGEWIKKVDDVGFISYICSKCGFELELEDCSDSYYCTNCGAKMRGEEK